MIERSGHQGKVEISGNILPVELGLVGAKVGDDVLIHAGCAISILQKKEKEELEELFGLLNEVIDEERR
ncbi:HypC/HybG/HupF family hydrogenase formation chaperone [Sporobacter termitidis]|uniref:HypC/HybG/HupF family hydrogenase formation chaperone n=1 Tax=Sporobacter termitidis TaxID=44749 RepID=UPI001FA83034|nr:HypC/HybG/HupF family hydrogenase formation chaperone [Sporobacter termitidis]